MTWIISDVDGCLTSERSEAFFGDELKKLLSVRERLDAMPSPIQLTLATGRPQPYGELLCKMLRIDAPIICENGAVIYTLEDNFSAPGPGLTPEIQRQLSKLEHYLVTEVLPDYPDCMIQWGKKAQVSIFSKNHSSLEPIDLLVRNFSKTYSLPLDINMSVFHLNISPEGISKGRAINHVMEQLHVPFDQRAGVGDTDGDLSMRDHVAWFACPANATKAIRAVADYVSPYPEIDGFLDILDVLERKNAEASSPGS